MAGRSRDLGVETHKRRPRTPHTVLDAKALTWAAQNNIDTAKLYDRLGLPEFYALEAFVQWHGTDS